ncbi:hypothetical protein B381_00510 [Stutzerimonas stutzeri NF13]|uniref:Uncharacterized protein n=1 Tax=Stutzerimonas stutzeri NF13 TaxID=1212548 RepID=M2TXL4_STUST|nr:hypothetical protein B381_00510 [Stutzerimonas stutzeri NF13]
MRPGSCSRRFCHSARADRTEAGFVAVAGAVATDFTGATGVLAAVFAAAAGAVVAVFATAAGAPAAVFAAFAAALSSARLGVLRTGSLTAFSTLRRHSLQET